MPKKRPPVAQYIVLLLLFLTACAYQVGATIAAFPGFLLTDAARWPLIPIYSHGKPTAQFVTTQAQDAGIRERDVIIAVNGRPFTGLAVFGEAVVHKKA